MRIIIPAALIAVLVPVAALAQNDPGAPPPPPVSDGGRTPFTGPRIEATLGYDHVGAGSGSASNQSIDGLMFGGGVGYDALVGRDIVIGVDGEATGSTAHAARQPYANDFGYGRVRPGRDLYVGGRIGFLASPTTLIYAKAGYTNAQLHVLAGSTNTSTDTNFKLDGYRVGAGVEHQLSARTYAKVEYRYSNYGRGEIDYPNGATSGRFDVDTDRHQVAIGYGLRF